MLAMTKQSITQRPALYLKCRSLCFKVFFDYSCSIIGLFNLKAKEVRRIQDCVVAFYAVFVACEGEGLFVLVLDVKIERSTNSQVYDVAADYVPGKAERRNCVFCKVEVSELFSVLWIQRRADNQLLNEFQVNA